MSKYLIVDDSRSIAKMLAEMLITEGHETVISNDGRNALTLIEAQKFDAIILDIAMPGFSGLEVIDKLEEMGVLKDNNIVILTASSNIDEQADSLKKRGINNVLKKPIDFEVLLRVLNS